MILTTNRRKIIAIYVLTVMVLVSLTVCGYYYSSYEKIKKSTLNTSGFSTDMAYYDLPRVNLTMGHNGAAAHIRVDISIEVSKKDMIIVQGYQPRIVDKLNIYLSNLDPAVMRRVSAAVQLRHDMLDEVNRIGMPVPVHDLLLRQMEIGRAHV